MFATVTVKDDGVRDVLSRVDRAARRTAPLFGRITNRMRNDTIRNFREGGWYGRAWPRSRRAAGMKRGKTLMRSGLLRNSIHAESGEGWARIGTSVPYAAIHQLGGTIPARVIRPRHAKALRWFVNGKPVFARSVRLPPVDIPARPYLPTDETGRLHLSLRSYIKTEAIKHLEL